MKSKYMFFSLYKHYWQSVLRSSMASLKTSNLIISLIAIAFLLLMFTVFLFTGGFDSIFRLLSPNRSLVDCCAILMFPGACIFISYRLFMQEFPNLNVDCYKLLPVRRETLFRFFIVKPLFNPLQFIAVYMLAGLILRQMIFHLGDLTGAGWLLLNSFLFVVTDVLLVGYVKFKYNINQMLALPVNLTIFLLFYLVTFLPSNILSLFENTLVFLFTSVWGSFIILTISLLTYKRSIVCYGKRYYTIEDQKGVREKSTSSGNRVDHLFAGKGQVMMMIRLIVKQIFRIKYINSLVMMGILTPVLVLMFSIGEKSISRFFVAGFFIYTPVLSLYSLQYKFFDLLMTQNISSKCYVLANYYVYLIITSSMLLITLIFNAIYPLADTLQLILFALTLIGPVLHLALFFSVKNLFYPQVGKQFGKMRESMGFADTFKAMGYVLIAIILPAFFKGHNVLTYGLLAIDIFTIVFHKWIIQISVWNFKRNKYKMIERFHSK
ncbi:DUF5687 family protein [Falsiporphyromonas endometrii]|uniref:DUF5687 family protein n=1 Tax=Falsiporphyromonas endometrii TaxID=1387297 RepID=A0ABV9K8P3_9PORP